MALAYYFGKASLAFMHSKQIMNLMVDAYRFGKYERYPEGRDHPDTRYVLDRVKILGDESK